MKNVIYIILVVLCFSCLSESNKEPLLYNEADADYESALESKTVFVSHVDDYEALSIQKLTEYFDLLKLKSQHPDFEKDIEIQLKQLATDSLLNIKFNGSDVINNIKQKGDIIKISDTLHRLSLEYHLRSDNKGIKDSIFAYIVSKPLQVDGNLMTSNKVKFSKN